MLTREAVLSVALKLSNVEVQFAAGLGTEAGVAGTELRLGSEGCRAVQIRAMDYKRG